MYSTPFYYSLLPTELLFECYKRQCGLVKKKIKSTSLCEQFYLLL